MNRSPASRMGIDPNTMPEQMQSCMTPADRERFGIKKPNNRAKSPEQSQFANWLLLQNSKGADIPFEWHPLHTRPKTTPSCFDFWVGVSTGIWIEFKRDRTCKLSDEQAEFRRKCEKRVIPAYVVYSADEAIELVKLKVIDREPVD